MAVVKAIPYLKWHITHLSFYNHQIMTKKKLCFLLLVLLVINPYSYLLVYMDTLLSNK